MKEKILIIEDDYNDYKKIVESIGNDKFDFIPENKEKFADIQDAFNIGTLKEYIRNIIQANNEAISVIICDLVYEGSNNKNKDGSQIIKFIRNDILLENNKLFTKFIPIIAYTNYNNGELAKEALLNGANVNIQKESNKHLKTLVEGYANYFKEFVLNNSISLELLSKSIELGFERNVIYLESLREQNNKYFQIIINFIFTQLTDSQRKECYNYFKKEISDVLTEKNMQKLNHNVWSEIKTAFEEYNKEGGFKQFVDTTSEILEDAEMLDTKGKVTIAAIKGIVGYLSML